MKKLIFLGISVIIGVLVYNKNNEIIIPSDAIRVRIIANSNNIDDLYEKKKIKDEIKKDLFDMVKNVESSFEARNVILNNMDKIKSTISNTTTNFSINYGINYFPRKTYKGVIYEEGDYQSLVITLGKGIGDNWWCILYPPLCLMEDNSNTTDVEYRSFLMDFLKS